MRPAEAVGLCTDRSGQNQTPGKPPFSVAAPTSKPGVYVGSRRTPQRVDNRRELNPHSFYVDVLAHLAT